MGISILMSLAISTAQAQSNFNVVAALGTTSTTNKTPIRTSRPQLTPEQLAEMQKQREEFRLQVERRAKERSDFLASVDTKNMSEGQRQNHKKLLATVERLNKIRVEMTQTNLATSTELRKELHDTGHLIDELYALERRSLFEELARSVGCKGPNVVEFANTVENIINNTSSPRTSSSFGGGHSLSSVRTNAPASGQGR